MTFREEVELATPIGIAFEVAPLRQALDTPNAVVFIYASWSGPAILAWKVLTTALGSLESLPVVIVVDIDELIPAQAKELLGHLPQGKGETFWIKDSNRIAQLVEYRESAIPTIIRHSNELFS